jgi:hypothetical protein
VQVDGVCLEDVVAVYCGTVNALVESAGVERGVVKVADGEGYGVCGRWQEAATPAQKCWVSAICASRPKWKPRPLFRPRGFPPPRLPRELGASVWVQSSLLDIFLGVV